MKARMSVFLLMMVFVANYIQGELELARFALKALKVLELRPTTDAVLHMSRIEFNELSSCEVRRLNQAYCALY